MLKLLHVDDDADILEVAKMSLELSGGFETVGCLSGEEALTIASDYMPDVLLLDVMMPGMSGPETLERLREFPSLEDVPAIFMTARVGAASEAELFGLGAKEIIQKPFDPMALGSQILDVLKR